MVNLNRRRVVTLAGFSNKGEDKKFDNWFKGIKPSKPINIEKPMSHFASLIADLVENGYIKNKKAFCAELIQSSLVFNTETVRLESIKNAMKENSRTRLPNKGNKNYINIQAFILNL